jgi:type VI secretion system protein VasG
MAEIEAATEKLNSKLAILESEWQRESAIVKEVLDLRASLADAGDAIEDKRSELKVKIGELDGFPADSRTIYPYVDDQAVASVVSDWTGIPVGQDGRRRDREHPQPAGHPQSSASSARPRPWR